MNMNPRTVYIYLLNEGTDVWRPAEARWLHDDVYELLHIDAYDPEDEEWQFAPGSIVRCENRQGRFTAISSIDLEKK
jgi:hypothetical protein